MEIKLLILGLSLSSVVFAIKLRFPYLVSTGTLIHLPIDTYNHWFESLPVEFKEKGIEQWGEPEQSGRMKQGNDFILPAVRIDNMLLLPDPSKGGRQSLVRWRPTAPGGWPAVLLNRS